MKYADVVIPLYKPDQSFYELLQVILLQTVQPENIILMNTQVAGYMTKDIKDRIKEFLSEDSIEIDKKIHIHIIGIDKSEFDHGTTRDMASRYSNADYLIYMTQDAIPKDQHLIENLLKPFQDEEIAVVYAKQEADEDADLIETYTRFFNYPEESIKKNAASIPELGIKTYFSSNVCAAYKRKLYDEVGGFQNHVILNEDMIFAATAIKKGYAVFYNAQAVVHHSHNYSWIQQFKRNFDIGVSQKQNSRIFEEVSSEKEGTALVVRMIGFLIDRKEYIMLVDFVITCMFKYAGYLLGKQYKVLPKRLIMNCTMNKEYWKE